MKPSSADLEAMKTVLGLLVDQVDFAQPLNDVPVAAGVFDESGRLVTSAINARESLADPTAHAEILALREAARLSNQAQSWRLSDCTLVVTLEPCAMCAGAALSARVKKVVYGAAEPKTGAAGSVSDILRDPRNLHQPEVVGGVLAEQCSAVLTEWFRRLRDSKNVVTDG